MSGIAAIVHLDGAPPDPAILELMVAAGAHRGPHGVGRLHLGQAAFAHLALHSTLESLDERQPLQSDDGTLVLVADARIDNRDDLAADLRSHCAFPIPDPSDAHLILAAYRRWDLDAPAHLVGDFAFVLWDERLRRLMACRDPMGMRPLHWARLGETLLIASEAQQVLAHPAVGHDLDRVALADFLSDHCPDDDRSMFRDVRRLPQASRLLAARAGATVERYWGIDTGRTIRYRSQREYGDHLFELLQQAVKARLRTTRPLVGLTVSGGLDSTSVAATVTHLRRIDPDLPELRGCSYAFPRIPTCDETIFVTTVSEALAMPVSFLDVERSIAGGGRSSVSPSRETPFTGWTPVTVDVMGWLAAQGGTVLLTGNALWGAGRVDADHYFLRRLLAGHLTAIGEVVRVARRQGRRPARALLRQLLLPLLPPGVAEVLRRSATTARYHRPPQWLDGRLVRETDLRERMGLRSGWVAHLRNLTGFHPTSFIPSTGSVGRAVALFDRIGSSHGIEVRHPLLDRRILEFVAAVPRDMVADPSMDRLVLRRAMSGRLPEEILTRTVKTRFLPVITMLTQRLLDDGARLDSQSLHLETLGLVDRGRFHRAVAQARSGPVEPTLTSLLWFSLALERWLGVYLSGNTPQSRPAAHPDSTSG